MGISFHRPSPSSAKSKWLILLGLILLALIPAGAPTALAHALLVRSEPAANAELLTAPASVEMWFSETLEPRFSHARLIDATGAEVFSAGPSLVDPNDATRMSLALTDLQPGIYTVVWTTLSSVDGHEWVGSFPITLLNPDGSRPVGGAAVTLEANRGDLPSPVAGAARWLSLLGAILLAGLLLFREIVARPVLLRRSLPSLAALLARSYWWLGIVGLIAVLLGGGLQMVGQVRIFDFLVSTRPGLLLLARQLMLIPFLVLFFVSKKPEQMGAPRRLLGHLRVAGEYLSGLGLLATFSLSSHAAAVPGRGWAVAGDFVHLLAAAAWMGGLLPLALIFWYAHRGLGAEEQMGLTRIVRRFSLLAAGAVFVLTVTGLFSSAVQLPTLASLWTTTYGWLLLGKLALVALALALAFLNNRSVHRPAAESAPARGLARRVGIEAVVSLGLLLVIALLVQTPPPPRPQPPVAPALPFIDIQQAGDLLIHLQISPNQPGNNRFWTHLYHPDASPIGEVQLVRLFFAPKRTEVGQARTDLPAEGNDIFVDEGAWMSQSGEWDVTVYVRRRGMDDVTAQYAVTIPPPPGVVAQGTPWQNPAAALPVGVTGGVLLLALGLAPFLWWRPLRRRNRDAAPLFGGVGAACLILGLVWGVQGLVGGGLRGDDAPVNAVSIDWAATPVVGASLSVLPSPAVSLLATPVSPLAQPGPTPTPGPPTPTAVPTPTPDDIFLAGAEIFQARCVQCHGPHGMGDGPDAAALPVQPAILPFHIPLHPDEDVYVFISEGFPSLGMPPFRETLSQEEILQVLRYLRVRFGGALP